MSDFLARLAQRALGAAPLVRPRLPGLFSPLDEEAAPASEALAVDSREPSPVPAPAPLSRAVEARDEMAAAAGTPPVRAPAPAVAPEQAKDFLPAHPSAPQATRPSRDEGGPAAPESPAPERWVPAESSASRILLLEKAAPRTQLANSPLPLVRPRREASPKEGAPGPGGIAYVERGPAQAPAVHITIGRVEVRANIAAPPAARPRPEHKPALSLREYLKRGGGKS